MMLDWERFDITEMSQDLRASLDESPEPESEASFGEMMMLVLLVLAVDRLVTLERRVEALERRLG